MKILFLGDASNYHATVAQALAELGHDVTLASDGGGWMGTDRHIDISRSPSPLGGAKLYWRLLHDERLCRGYDVVFLCDTSFVKLRPHRQLDVFKRLKRQNGPVILTALGSNSLYVNNLTGPNPALPYSEWQSPWGEANKHLWLTPEQIDYTRYLYENVDGIVTALYEYDEVARAEVPGQNIVYAGIPVGEMPEVKRQPEEKLRILTAYHPGREAEKGMDILLPKIYRFMRETDRPVELLRASGIPFADFKRLLGTVDIVLDQYYALSPATTALMAVRAGAIPVTGAHPDYLDFIGATTAPLIDARKLDLINIPAADPTFPDTPETVAKRLLQTIPH